MSQIKGFAIRGLLRFIKESNYPGGIPAILAKLPKEDQKHFAHPISSSTWYPYSTFVHLLRAIDDSIANGDLTFCRKIGRMGAERDFQGVFKIVAAIASFESLIQRGTFMWGKYFSQGKMTVAEANKNGCRLQMLEFPDVDQAHCILIEGWLEKLGSLCGVKNIRVEQSKCIHRGDPFCEYHGIFKA